MVRCDEFYKEWQTSGNFCEKHPDTAARIETFLDRIVVELAQEVAKSEILAPENLSMGAIVSERASHPLVSETDLKKGKEAIKQIVKAAENKIVSDERHRVTNQEVAKIVQSVKGEITFTKSPESLKDAPSGSAPSKTTSTFNRTNDNIEWAKWTWNPVVGCKHGCPYCYAKDIAIRFYGNFEPSFKPERLDSPKVTSLPAGASDDIGLKTVFVCSMADLFGDWVPQEWIDAILESVRESPRWNFLFLTKNPKRMIGIDWPSNAWVGTTVDVQSRVTAAEEAFRQIKAPVRFVSCEPLQEKVEFSSMEMFDWIIIGGRSRSSKLPEFQPRWEWVESLLQQAREHGLKVYFKPNLTVRPKEYPV